MNFWENKFTDWQIYEWELIIDDWFFLFAMAFFAIELIRLVILKKMSWHTLGDATSSFVTLIAHLSIIFLVAGVFLTIYYFVYQNLRIIQLPNNGWTIALCIILADFAYYWMHRAAHRIGVAWATHTVHHSAEYYNISVAYRHGPLDAIISLPFHLPLVILGFDPILVLFSGTMVQLFQTLLHTEVIKKFPRLIEAIFNTPSHHRVHHGSNPQYIDKNYAGILIVWDRMFGTFEEEKETVVYGIAPPLKSINPITIFTHGFTGLFRNIYRTKGILNKFAYLYQPPGWTPKDDTVVNEKAVP